MTDSILHLMAKKTANRNDVYVKDLKRDFKKSFRIESSIATV